MIRPNMSSSNTINNQHNNADHSTIKHYSYLIHAKLLYILLYGGYGSTDIWLGLYYFACGLSPSEIGLLAAVAPALGFVAAPTWTAMADKYGMHRTVLLTTIFINCIIYVLLSQLRTFFSILTLLLLQVCLTSAMSPLFEASMLQLLAHTPGYSSSDYGVLRLYGAVGFGLASVVSGLAMQLRDANETARLQHIANTTTHTGLNQPNTYMPIFLIYLLCQSMTLLLILFHPTFAVQYKIVEVADDTVDTGSGNKLRSSPPPNERREERERSTETHVQPTDTSSSFMSLSPPLVLPSRVELRIFLFVVLVSGINSGVINNYLFLFVGTLGSNAGIDGVSRMITCLAELPFFFLSKRIVCHLGVWGVLSVAFATFVIRLMYYSIMTTPNMLLPIEVLHGITFALLWSATTVYVDSLSPPGWNATYQGLLAGLHFGLGPCIGAIGGGIMYSAMGAVWLFRAAAALSAMATIASWICWKYYASSSPLSSPSSSPSSLPLDSLHSAHRHKLEYTPVEHARFELGDLADVEEEEEEEEDAQSEVDVSTASSPRVQLESVS